MLWIQEEDVVSVGVAVAMPLSWLLHAFTPIFVFLSNMCWASLSSLLRWKKGLPPGNWCVPFVGETLQFLSNPEEFFSTRQARYGDTYATNLLGWPTIVTSSPEVARFVLGAGRKNFKPGYLRTTEEAIDPKRSLHGPLHSRIRRIIQPALRSEAIQAHIPFIDARACVILASWMPGGAVDTYQEIKKFTSGVTLYTTCGVRPGLEADELMLSFYNARKALIAYPIKFPNFTNFLLAVKGRKQVCAHLVNIIARKRVEKGGPRDILDALMEWRENGKGLSDKRIVETVMAVLVAGNETSASLLVWIIRYLYEDPDLLARVQAEHDGIKQRRSVHEGPLSWHDVNAMSLTLRVIQETLRLSSIVRLIPRTVKQDVEINGHLFPKGWKIFTHIAGIHHNAKYFPDPRKFDPSRFEVPPKRSTYMPFGSGNKVCPGADLAKLETLIFLHHLITKFRWKPASTQLRPVLLPQSFSIKVESR